MIKKIPKNWWEYHHKDCGTKFRGCSAECPKDVYEKSGVWIGPSRIKIFFRDIKNSFTTLFASEASKP